MLYINTELGLEKQCSMCGEYYPIDADFFYRNGFRHGVPLWTARCKACFVECYRGEK